MFMPRGRKEKDVKTTSDDKSQLMMARHAISAWRWEWVSG